MTVLKFMCHKSVTMYPLAIKCFQTWSRCLSNATASRTAQWSAKLLRSSYAMGTTIWYTLYISKLLTISAFWSISWTDLKTLSMLWLVSKFASPVIILLILSAVMTSLNEHGFLWLFGICFGKPLWHRTLVSLSNWKDKNKAINIQCLRHRQRAAHSTMYLRVSTNI